MMVELNLDYDDELIKDFLGEMTDAHEAVEQTFYKLEHHPAQPALLDELFRTVHSVKSNLRMMHLNRYSDLVHAFENVLDMVRNGEMGYVPLMADMFLLSVGEVRTLCEAVFAGGDTDEARCGVIERAVGRIANTSREGTDEAVKVVIRLLDANYLPEETPAAPAAVPEPAPAAVSGSTPPSTAPASGPVDEALGRFAAMAAKVEQRLPHWAGRSRRIAELAAELNQQGGAPVDARQLAAAAWLHHVGLVRLDPALEARVDGEDAAAEPRIAAYPAMGAGLLRKETGWETAARIAEQHREWPNGEGYPAGLSGEAMEEGAKILAIAGAFEGMMQADPESKRLVLQAVTAINGQAGRRFDAGWVKRLNELIRRRYVG